MTLPQSAHFVGSKAGGSGKASKLYSFVPKYTYISMFMPSRHCVQFFQSPACSSLLCKPQRVYLRWLRLQLLCAKENMTYSSSSLQIQFPQHSVLTRFSVAPQRPHRRAASLVRGLAAFGFDGLLAFFRGIAATFVLNP